MLHLLNLLPSRCLQLLLLAIICSGCGGPGYDGPRRYPVSGQVQYDGVPLSEGVINLMPTDSDGRAASAAIENGSYAIALESGPTAGKYRVEILGYETTRQSEDPDLGPEVKQILPARYNAASSLEIEIVGEHDGVHNFDLEK